MTEIEILCIHWLFLQSSLAGGIQSKQDLRTIPDDLDREGQGQYPDSEHWGPELSLFTFLLLCVKDLFVDMKEGTHEHH